MALAERRSLRLAMFPPTSVFELEAVDRLAETVMEEVEVLDNRVFALNQISIILENAERQFQHLLGDPHSTSNQRGHYTIGRLGAVLQNANVMEYVAESWVESPDATLEQRVEGLRFVLACMIASGLVYPLTEENFVTCIRHWASVPLPPRSNGRNGGVDLLEEAQRTYSTGLLAIALTNSSHCDETVRSGYIINLVADLRSSIAAMDSQVELRSPSNRQQPMARPLQGDPHPVQRSLQGVIEPPLRSVSGVEPPGCRSDDDTTESEPSPSYEDSPEDPSDTILATSSSCPVGTQTRSGKEEINPSAGNLPLPPLIAATGNFPTTTWMDCPPEAAAMGGRAQSETQQPLLVAASSMPETEMTAVPTLAEPVGIAGGNPLPAGVPSKGNAALLSYYPELQSRQLMYSVQCAASLGEYLEFLPPLMANGGIKMVLRLLDAWRSQPAELNEALRMLSSLLAHRKLADALVDEGGLDLLLSLPCNSYTHTSLSLVQVGLTLIPSAFQKLAALPPPTPARFMETALKHLTCSLDLARKNAAVFLGNALVQPVMLSAFDEWGGLKRLLAALSGSLLLLRSGAGQELKQEKQMCYHLCQALSLYFRSHLVQSIRAINQQGQAASELIPVGPKQVDASLALICDSKQVAEAFVCQSWTPAASFAAAGGVSLMLDIIQASPGERYFTEMAHASLEVLQIVTLSPGCRSALLNCSVSSISGSQQTPIATLLSAASGQAFLGDHEVKQAALRVIVNCVTMPASVAELFPLQSAPKAAVGRNWRAQQRSSSQDEALTRTLEQGYAAARSAVRNANGLRTMLSLLQLRSSASSVQPGRLTQLRALAAQALLGLAKDPDICHTLAQLQVGKKLAELLHETAGAACRTGSAPSNSSVVDWSRALMDTAMELISMTTPGMGVVGSVAAFDATAPALQSMERAAIAAASHITYEPAELLGLIRDHLSAAGLVSTAQMLEKEAGWRTAQRSCDSVGRVRLAEDRPTSGLVQAKKRISFGPSLQRSAMKAASQPHQPERSSSLPLGGLQPGLAIAKGLKESRQSVGLQTAQLSSLPASVFASPAPRLPNTIQQSPQAGAKQLPATLNGRKRSAASQLGQQAHPSLRSAQSPAHKPDQEVFSPAWQRRTCLRPSTATAADCNAQAQPQGNGSSVNSFSALQTDAEPDLANLPSRHARQLTVQPAAPCQTPQTARSVIREALASPPERTLGPGSAATAEDKAVGSRLSTIVLQYLRQQHKAACLSAQQPVSTLPPLSLVQPNSLPKARHLLAAPSDVTRRVLASQATPFGGIGGRRQQRHYVYSRFRHQRSIRDREDGTAVFRSCSFMEGGKKLLIGTMSGAIRLYPDLSSNVVELYGSHNLAINKLQVHEGDKRTLVLSSTRNEVKLWDAAKLDYAALATFDGCRGGIFSPDARFIAASTNRSTAAHVYDAATSAVLLTITEPETSGRAPRDIAYSRTGELLLWGSALWDPRAPRRVHRFDVFAENCGGSNFHPAGLEAILNSEVWDLRTHRLVRSVSCLDGTSLAFNSTGTVAYAYMRRTGEDLNAALQTRRGRHLHPLHTAFRTVDMTNYTEIATVEVDGRCVLDLAAEPLDSCLAMITIEPEALSSSTRLYDIGRRRMQGDDSDFEEAEEGSDGEESEGTEDEDPDIEEAALLPMSDAEDEGGDEDDTLGGESEAGDEAAEEGSDNEDFAVVEEMDEGSMAAGDERDDAEADSNLEENEADGPESASETLGSDDSADVSESSASFDSESEYNPSSE